MDRWDGLLRLAGNDLKVAMLVLNEANDELMQNSAAYHTQQAVEKIMKAVIAKSGHKANLTHNITELSKDMDEYGLPYPDWIRDKDDELTSWSTTIRYNANFKSDHDEIVEIIDGAKKWLKEIVSAPQERQNYIKEKNV